MDDKFDVQLPLASQILQGLLHLGVGVFHPNVQSISSLLVTLEHTDSKSKKCHTLLFLEPGEIL